MLSIEKDRLAPYRALLRRCPLFIRETEENLEKLTYGGRCACYADGEQIAETTAPGAGLVVIVEAEASVLCATAGGRQQPITYLHQGDFWGPSLVPPSRRIDEVVVSMAPACVAWQLRQERVLPYLAGQRVRLWEAMVYLGTRLRHTHDQLEAVLVHTARARLAHRLVQLQSEAGPVIHATHRSLAAQIGTRREEVCRLLTEFREAGLIATTGRRSEIVILDPLGLAAVE